MIRVEQQTTGCFNLRIASGQGAGETSWTATPGPVPTDLASGRSAAIGIRRGRPSRPRPDLRPVLLIAAGLSPHPRAYLM